MFEAIKYIGICDNYILTHKGFKKLEKMNSSTIRLFNSASELHKYLEDKLFRKKYRLNVVVKKVKVSYEVEL